MKKIVRNLLHFRGCYSIAVFCLVLTACVINNPAQESKSQVIAVHEPAGAPPPLARALAKSVVTELNRRGYKAGLAGSVEADLELSGQAVTLERSQAPHVAIITWLLVDRKQREIASVRQYVTGSHDAWAYGSPSIIRVIGEQIADDLSSLLNQPARKLVKSVPQPKPVIDEARSLEDQFDLTPKKQMIEPTATMTPPQPALPVVSTGGESRPFGLWVDAVTGAPGDGNASLTVFLLDMLEDAGVPFARTAGTASHYIQGVVDVEAMDATMEHVTIVWIISNSSGQELGRVSQSNDIVRGSLHQEWRDTAKFAAQGGVEGILAILERNMGEGQ